MIKFLADENFDHKTLAGLKRREPGLDIVAAQEVGLSRGRRSAGAGVGCPGGARCGHAPHGLRQIRTARFAE